jgi:hypothetical protein
MLNCWKSIRGLTVAVFAGGLALTAVAADSKSGQAAPSANPQASAKAPAAPSAVTVRDVKTGQVRPATAQEIQALAAELDQLFDRKASAEKPVRMPNGSTAYTVTGNFASGSVARRNADGKLETGCFDEAAPAKKFMGLTPDGVPSTTVIAEEK